VTFTLLITVGKLRGEQRARIVRHLHGSIEASQLGHGLSAASCEIAHLLLRTSAEAAEARGESFGALFVDVKTAFATAARQLALPFQGSSSWYVDMLAGLGFDRTAALDVLDEVLRRRAWGNVSAHHQAAVGAYSVGAWVQIDGISGVHQPQKGVPAGVPLADIIFAVIANRVTKSIQIRLLESDLVSNIGFNHAISLFGNNGVLVEPESFVCSEVSIVDDVVYFISGPAELLCGRVSAAMTIIHQEYSRHGLVLNFDPTKTACVLTFSGKAAKAARISAWTSNAIYFMSSGTQIKLPVVQTYKHVGITYATN
jgi:hypothetical protein